MIRGTAAVIGFCLFGSAAWFAPATAQRPTTISAADLLRFSSFGDPLTLSWLDQGSGQAAIRSPDGRWAVVVVRGGDPVSETNEARLLLLDLSQRLSDLDAVELTRFASETSAQPIAFVRWLDDSRTLVFAGSRGTDGTKVFRIDIANRALQQLGSESMSIAWYGTDRTGDRLVTLVARRSMSTDDSPDCRRHGCRAETGSIYEYARNGADRETSGTIDDIAAGRSRALVRPEEQDDALHFCDPELAGGVSPDGRYALRYCRLRAGQVPRWWGDYDMSRSFAQCREAGNPRCWRRGFLIDLDRNSAAAWTEAPQANVTLVRPIWIDGGRRVILPQAFEPLPGRDAAARARAAARYVVQLLDPSTGRTTQIAQLPSTIAGVSAASWNQRSETLRLDTWNDDFRPLAPVVYRRRAGQWSQIAESEQVEAPASRIVFDVRQSLVSRPVFTATDATTGAKRDLLDPNAWLEQRRRGAVEAIEWSIGPERRGRGGLYYPPDYEPGRRYPLVIQTHGFDANTFSLHGRARNFPGEALAARGIFVLQLDEYEGLAGEDQTPRFLAATRAGYESAIDHLARLGLVDRERVGIIGWSDTGNTSSYFFTHSEFPVAAAALVDAGTDGWMHFMANGGAGSQGVVRYGGPPFGAELSGWLELAPTFSLDRVAAPLLMAALSDGPYVGMWDMYVGLRSQSRPVEFWGFPGGTHDVMQASQRLRINQLLVDWFAFWLLGEERRTAGAFRGENVAMLATQYARWHEQRMLHEANLARGRPPLLQWTPTAVPRR